MNAHVPFPAPRLVVLSESYDKWISVYDRLGVLENEIEQTRPGDKNGLDALRISTSSAVFEMHRIFDEAMMTPATGLHDLGLKARMVHECMRHEWYSGEPGDLERGELLARSMMIEMMAMAGLSPIPRSNPDPNDLLIDLDPAIPAEFRQAAE